MSVGPLHDRFARASAGQVVSSQDFGQPVSPPSSSAPKQPTDNVSLADSAYSSTAGSNRSTTTSNANRTQLSNHRSARQIPGTDLFWFRTGGNEEALRHYESVSPAIDGLLCREVTEKGFDPSCTMIIRLAVIGKTQEDARFWVVVFGRPELEESIQAFFKSDHIAALLNPSRTDIPSLPFIFIARGPTLHSAVLGVDVHCPILLPTCATYCGFPIVLIAGQAPSGQRPTRKATFGGIIKVTNVQGGYELYGLTAGHAVQELLQHSKEPTASMSISVPPYSDAHAADPCTYEQNTLGHVLDQNQFPGVSAGRAKPSHDWALFGIDSPRPNQAFAFGEATGTVNSAHEILAVEKPRFHDGVSDTVLLLGSTSSTRRGELSGLPARIWVKQSEGFVKAYPLELDNDIVSDGDSGAWVVHHAAPELYGHVVATDAFGDAYVIPAPDTLKNIQECMGAAAVTLPTHKDFTTTMSGEDSDTKSRVDLNSNLESETSHQISLDAEAKSPAVSSDLDQGNNPYDSSGSQDTASMGHEGFYAEYSPAHTLVDGYEDVAAVSAKQYVDVVSDYANSRFGDSLHIRSNYTRLARYLQRPYISRASSRSVLPHKEKELESNVVIMQDLSLPVNDDHRTQEFGSIHEFIQTCEEKKHQPNPSLLLFVRGYPSPQWLCHIGSLFKVDPEFFRHYMEEGHSSAGKGYFASPSLPSSNRNIVRLRVPTIGASQQAPGESMREIEHLRNTADEGMHRYHQDLKLGQGIEPGDSIVRSFSVHNQERYSIEQDVSIWVDRFGEGWIAIILLDNGNDLGQIPGPWSTVGAHSRPWHNGIFSHGPYKRDRASKILCTRISHPPQEDVRLGSLTHAVYHPPTLNGRWLNSNAVSCDAFYALSEIFSFFAAAENQFLNMIEEIVAAEMKAHGNAKEGIEVFVAMNLHYNRNILDQHISRLKEYLEIVMAAGDPSWPKASEQQQKANPATDILLKDFAHLLRKAENLSRLCGESITVVMNTAMLAESRSAISQAKKLSQLTLLAFLFLPLSLTTAIFGMNVKELDSAGRLNIWVWVAVAVPVTFIVMFSMGAFSKYLDGPLKGRSKLYNYGKRKRDYLWNPPTA